jgi:glycosyltransferase involved in cell wall biosynthesis
MDDAGTRRWPGMKAAKLGIVYHMPFWRGADGTLREVEGSFSRYVDGLAPYFDEISLCVPVLDGPRGEGTPIRSSNVTLAPLPPFDGPAQFYPRLLTMAPRIARWVRTIDVLHCRVPTPAAVFAFAFAHVVRRPAFLLVVGDLRALLPTMPYRGVKRGLWRAYTEFEERGIQWMADRALTFANGAALTRKHTRSHRAVIETTTTTIAADDIASRVDTCAASPLRVLTVSRIDPRKGLRALPAAIRLLSSGGIDVRLDIIGPCVGRTGEGERDAIVDEARRLDVADRVSLLGPVALDRLMPMYRAYDIFVLPTLPGEGIPRVLLEAMSAGLPVVTTRVAGIPGLVTHEANGLLLDRATPDAIAAAIVRLAADAPLRQHLIARGYETARRFTLQAQSAQMMDTVSRELHLVLRHPVVLPAA